MNVASLIKHLEANVVEELGAKKAALQSIKAQELAITERDPDALEKTMDAMNSILPGDTSRAKRRTRLIAELSELSFVVWGRKGSAWRNCAENYARR